MSAAPATTFPLNANTPLGKVLRVDSARETLCPESEEAKLYRAVMQIVYDFAAGAYQPEPGTVGRPPEVNSIVAAKFGLTAKTVKLNRLATVQSENAWILRYNAVMKGKKK